MSTPKLISNVTVSTNRAGCLFFNFFSSEHIVFLNVRSIKKSDEDIPVPPLLKSAALWGMPTSLFCIYHNLASVLLHKITVYIQTYFLTFLILVLHNYVIFST